MFAAFVEAMDCLLVVYNFVGKVHMADNAAVGDTVVGVVGQEDTLCQHRKVDIEDEADRTDIVDKIVAQHRMVDIVDMVRIVWVEDDTGVRTEDDDVEDEVDIDVEDEDDIAAEDEDVHTVDVLVSLRDCYLHYHYCYFQLHAFVYPILVFALNVS